MRASSSSSILVSASGEDEFYAMKGGHLQRIDLKYDKDAVTHELLAQTRAYFKKKYPTGDSRQFFDDIRAKSSSSTAQFLSLTKHHPERETQIRVDRLVEFLIKTLDLKEFAKQVGKLVEEIDVDHSGEISYQEFVDMLKEPMPSSRRALVVKAFARCQRKLTKSGSKGQRPLKADDVFSLYHAGRHPDVVSKKVKASDHLQQLRKDMVGDEKHVEVHHFIRYYEGSDHAFTNDDEFGLMMSYCWGVAFIPSYSLKKVHKLMLNTVLEACNNDPQESITFVKTIFEECDLNHDGVLVFSEFTEAMKRLGVEMGKGELKALFEHFDLDGSGAIDGLEFQSAVMNKLQKLKKHLG